MLFSKFSAGGLCDWGDFIGYFFGISRNKASTVMTQPSEKRQSFVVAMPFPLQEKVLSFMRLFHLHSTVKIQPFSPAFPSAESTAKAFCRLFLWIFKEKSINHFL
ncbi:hypothetical protein [uncultured Bilophila sp.]|uniref:hypothetical protein n=1 Tax=uncultured Bilophila sp. TaxID=529385 RepID=UPI00266F9B72|nr:hypothetical protein [uncultured Bilophila sp.]